MRDCADAASPPRCDKDGVTTPAEFPQDGDVAEKLRFLLAFAVLAPSGHNTQPWLFRVDGQVVELHADRSRALAVVDPHDRELTISCGAALQTLLVAMGAFGLRGAVQLTPDPDDADLLARVSVADGAAPDPDEAGLFAAITRRHTNRHAFEARDVPAELVGRLVADAAAEGAWLHVLTAEERAAAIDLVAEGDRAQMADARFRRELAAWVHPNSSRSADGMRGYGFGVGEIASYAGPFVIRTFDVGKGQAAKDRELAEGSPLLAVLGTAADDPGAWLRCGRALQRVLLRGCANDVSSSYLNQPIEVPELRTRLAETLARAGGFPQLVLRFGYGPAGRGQPRRPVDEVIVGEAEHRRHTIAAAFGATPA